MIILWETDCLTCFVENSPPKLSAEVRRPSTRLYSVPIGGECEMTPSRCAEEDSADDGSKWSRYSIRRANQFPGKRPSKEKSCGRKGKNYLEITCEIYFVKTKFIFVIVHQNFQISNFPNFILLSSSNIFFPNLLK